MKYFKQLAVAADQCLNAALGGWADETLSARAWRGQRDGRLFGRIATPLIDALFAWQKQPNDNGHCYNSYLNEKKRNSLPPEYRTE